MDKAINSYGGGGKTESNFKNSFSNKNHSFTLAEVLITLIIIGIIAAITVPVVMANHRKTETTAKLKKFYSNLSNAVKLTEIEYGQPVYEFDFTGGVHTSETYSILSSIFSKLSAEYLGTEYAQNRFKDGESYIVYCENVFWNLDSYMLPDGTLLGSESGHDEYLLVDINGEKGPNVCGRDIFGFNIGIGNICSHSKNKSLCFPQKDKNIQTTREELITSCADDQSPVGCTKLIADDGWEIKDDYPIRL